MIKLLFSLNLIFKSTLYLYFLQNDIDTHTCSRYRIGYFNFYKLFVSIKKMI